MSFILFVGLWGPEELEMTTLGSAVSDAVAVPATGNWRVGGNSKLKIQNSTLALGGRIEHRASVDSGTETETGTETGGVQVE